MHQNVIKLQRKFIKYANVGKQKYGASEPRGHTISLYLQYAEH